jgi:hypothetical protein
MLTHAGKGGKKLHVRKGDELCRVVKKSLLQVFWSFCPTDLMIGVLSTQQIQFFRMYSCSSWTDDQFDLK